MKTIAWGCLLAIAAVGAMAQEQNTINGVFTESPDSPELVGAHLTITGLTSKHPTMVWPDGSDHKLKKLHQDPALSVLQSVGPTGGTDTVFLETHNQKFLIVSVGTTGVAKGHSATVSSYRGDIKPPAP